MRSQAELYQQITDTRKQIEVLREELCDAEKQMVEQFHPHPVGSIVDCQVPWVGHQMRVFGQYLALNDEGELVWGTSGYAMKASDRVGATRVTRIDLVLLDSHPGERSE